MTTREVHVALLEEGIPVWRATKAIHVSGDTYVLIRPDDYDAEDESWQFPPGSVVRCETRKIADGDIFAAVNLIKTDCRVSA